MTIFFTILLAFIAANFCVIVFNVIGMSIDMTWHRRMKGPPSPRYYLVGWALCFIVFLMLFGQILSPK